MKIESTNLTLDPAEHLLSVPPHLDANERRCTEELIARMAEGDEEALTGFYDRLSATLYGVALKMMRDEQEAEDVLQEAFIYMWHKASAYNSQLGRPGSWAVMILRNKAIDRLRSRKRAARIVERATEEFSHTADIDERSADEPSFREQRAIVRSALSRLPDEQRQALDLAFFSGLTHEEIASHLRRPLGTIKARVRRALIRMRDLVRDAR